MTATTQPQPGTLRAICDECGEVRHVTARDGYGKTGDDCGGVRCMVRVKCANCGRLTVHAYLRDFDPDADDCEEQYGGTTTERCTRRGCYAEVDRRPHEGQEPGQERHGISVAESPARRSGPSETWPDGWSVQLRAIGDEPWHVEVFVYAKTWPEKAAPYCVYADYSVTDTEGLAAALIKAEDLRKRLAGVTR
jgi:hypothetical protein